MEWERKFSTIIHETEANLDRVRRRLEAARHKTDIDVSFTSALPTVRRSVLPAVQRTYLAANQVLPMHTCESISKEMSVSSGPPIWVTVLEDRIIKQKKTIDTLSETIVSLQDDKEKQRSAISELKDVVANLQERIEEKGIDLDTETKILKWKQEASHEIHELKQQLRRQPQAESTQNSHPSQPMIERLRSQVDEVKLLCVQETESARRDVDYYKTRMMRLEKNITVLSEELSELTRRHTDLKTDVSAFAHRSLNDYRDLRTSIGDRLGDVQITRAEVSELKSGLADIATTSHRGSQNSPFTVVGSSSKSDRRPPTQWRDLLSHSPSSTSLDSNDSTLGSGYLARRQETSSNDVAIPLRQPRAVPPSLIYYQTDKPLLFVILIWLSYMLILFLIGKVIRHSLLELLEHTSKL